MSGGIGADASAASCGNRLFVVRGCDRGERVREFFGDVELGESADHGECPEHEFRELWRHG